MKKKLTLVLLGLILSLATSIRLVAQSYPLQPIQANAIESHLTKDELLFTNQQERWALKKAVDNSLNYLNTNSARIAYQNYPVEGITRQRVKKSLSRFRQLLLTTRNPVTFQNAIQREFEFYKSVGNDDQGTVIFTGYFQPVYQASLSPTSEFRYPLYRKPSDLDNWQKPHPTRAQLEGNDGLLGKNGPLSGYELVWLKDRFQAFLVQIQGSAQLQLTDGRIMTVGFNGNTDYPYNSIAKELVNDDKLELESLSLPLVMAYFNDNPQDLDKYLPRNNRFIFFQETNGSPAMGSIGVPVTANRSIATDKSLMPPGALALIHTRLPETDNNGEFIFPWVNRYVLDQDTGSAIKGAGRVDIYMGTGKLAGERAGVIHGEGELYYLLLKQ